ncbi:3-hydroxybutyryl-CoA dehydratase [Candidatus Syntrophocurvum alkaliphilum]|uniref:short-chain-enoyl-CoA hydratase n=1 Tax=Candidatus Syntrophocurvum alkaliphilum TaxID=2293317 RepID=A0A6I6DAX9_9FIRM|nr:short-chain-enoyl-CoA hydratase [Candidatus Syntrophocurvum alkaliphilum]QGT98664.1 3-hydroxybutyryl-CoA dehydratase [Candidatus Syntrophocurvum alkaliphilum]
MDYNNILLEKKDRIAVLYINRPKALNALNKETLIEIKDAALKVKDDDEVDVMIIAGKGDKAFVAGADITAMSELSAMEGREFGAIGQEAFSTIESMEKPVIAAIHGFALGGGCELAMACDIRICSFKAKFGQPEVGLGVTPGFGGTQRLPRIVGEGMAKQLLYTGDVIDANEALRIGLVNAVVTEQELWEYVLDMANRIVAKGQLSVRLCKAAVNTGMQTDIDRAMSIEADIFGLCFATEDQKEGMKAFTEKRKPDFKNK